MEWTDITPEHLMMVTLAVIAGTAGVMALNIVAKNKRIRKRITKRQEFCRQAKAQLEEAVQKYGLSEKQRDKIVGLKFKELQKMLQTGELSSEEALKAYQSKAVETNKVLNFMVEPVQEAMEIAKACDKNKKEKKRPLHGVPISIKENYFIKGYDSTGGMSYLLERPAQEDGVVLKVLKYQGAVPFVRTNIPQHMITTECSNPIYGTTVNPHNKNRGPGGSSGGEAAILGSEASILGWGTDVGGSLRVPSDNCGICCLKPTRGRLSCKSCEELGEGQNVVIPTCGPMARDVDTLVEAMRAVLCQYHFELDPDVPPIPFRNQIYESIHSLRIGYYIHDGSVQPIPGVERAVLEAKKVLENKGHTLVPIEVPNSDYMFGDLLCKVLFGDGGRDILAHMSDDFVDPSIQLIVTSYKLPIFIQNIIIFLMNTFSGEKLPGKVMKSTQGAKSVTEWWELVAKVERYRSEFLSMWRDHQLDAVICPTMPYVAVPTGCVKYLLGGVSYCSLYNLLNYPAGCVPVTKVTAVDQAKMKDYPTNTTTHQYIKKFYSSDTGGLPVAVQCVGLPFQEELVLRVMKELETGVKENKQL